LWLEQSRLGQGSKGKTNKSSQKYFLHVDSFIIAASGKEPGEEAVFISRSLHLCSLVDLCFVVQGSNSAAFLPILCP
jgi:hypothetical protein